MRSHEMLTETEDSSTFPGDNIPGMSFAGNRGSRSHHVVTKIDESGHIHTITIHPHGLAGFKAALAQIQEDPNLKLKFLRAFVDPTSNGMHGQTKNRGGDGAEHTTNELNEFKSENADFSRVQERELTAQLTAYPNLNIKRTPNDDLIITERLTADRLRKIKITHPDHGVARDLVINVSEEINGQADPQQNLSLRTGFNIPPDIFVLHQTPNFSTNEAVNELLQTIATRMRIFQIFATLDETHRARFAEKLTDDLNPNLDWHNRLSRPQVELLHALSENQFNIRFKTS